MSIASRQVEKIKIFAFDFDGVILDSAEIKFAVFDEMFEKFPEYAEHMKAYARRNAGYSRYVQFRYFYEELMGLRYDAELEAKVIGEFADKVTRKVLEAPFIDGAPQFLERSKINGTKTYIVTGTPQKDILKIVAQRGIADLFDGIFGSPELKEDILLHIMRENCVDGDEVMFFGDAMSDFEAAMSAGTGFIGVGTLTNFPEGVRCIQDFADLM